MAYDVAERKRRDTLRVRCMCVYMYIYIYIYLERRNKRVDFIRARLRSERTPDFQSVATFNGDSSEWSRFNFEVTFASLFKRTYARNLRAALFKQNHR